MIDKIQDRFLRYIGIETTSDPDSGSVPSTPEQFLLAKFLKEELEEMDLNKVKLDNKCYLTAELPANNNKKCPVVGFIAHLDTSPDMTAKQVKPKIIQNYDGKDIILNKEKNIILSPEDFPELTMYKGQTLITTSGDTLLGADDKAGIAEIMTALEYLVKNPDIKHGTVKIAFTPDEEIGRGAKHFDVKKFGADYAYTIDGGEIGELEYENFNAAGIKIKISGRNVHPGYAKNKMLNAIQIAYELNALLPADQRPENTENYEGFFHLMNITGEVENAKMQYIIRDFNSVEFENKKQLMVNSINFLNEKYKKNIITYELTDQYFNMKEKIEPVFHIVKIAEQAMKDAGVKPKIQPIRGGTDGSQLSYMGLPCPNIFAGGHNFHGKYEFVPVESMEKASKVIINIIKAVCNQ